MKRAPRRTTRQIFAVPFVIGVATLAGIVLGLTGDGLRDVAAWLLLSFMPISLCLALVRGGVRSSKS